MTSQRGKSKKTFGNDLKNDDPIILERRLFIGNLPTNQMSHHDLESIFSKYGKITATSMFRGFGFVEYERKEDADAASKAENGRIYQSYRLDIDKAVDRRNMNKVPARSSPPRRNLYGYGEGQEPRRDRDRSPLRSSPRRVSRETREGRDARGMRDVRDEREPRDIRDVRISRDFRDGRDGRERDYHESRDARDMRDPRDTRDLRDARDARDLRDPRDTRDLRDLRESRDSRDTRDSREFRDARDTRDTRDARVRDGRDTRDARDPLFERYREARDPRDPIYSVNNSADKYRLEDLYRKKDEVYDRYREPADRFPEDRVKREERRREELYRQYFDEIQRKVEAERPVDCSVVVVNKQSKDYAETVGRKVRDLGMMVDLIFLNTEISLSQALEDVARGGSPFSIVVAPQHQTHRSCTVNILHGTPQEHRNMPMADAMLLVSRSYERYKVELREKEREDIARQAAKLSAEAILKERGAQDEGGRGTHPPAITTLLSLLADNRYVTAEEIDKVILFLQQRKERLLAISGDSLTSHISRPTGATLASSLDVQSSLGGSQSLQLTQQLGSVTSTPQTTGLSQQELQAEVLRLFNSGGSTTSNQVSNVGSAAPSQNYGNMSNMSNIQQRSASMEAGLLGPAPQRSQPIGGLLPNNMGAGTAIRSAAPRPGPSSQMQSMYGQLQNRIQAPGNVPVQRPGVSGINFDNPSVLKALDTLIQSGPPLSHLVGQTAGQDMRGGPQQQSSMASYPRNF